MDSVGYRLGVDFGTSNTVAMLAWPDGHVRPLLFDGSPSLPSSVYAEESGGLLVGRDAAHAARIAPERYEPNPKRRIDEPSVLLGDREIPTVDLIAAVLARVATEARRVTGGGLGGVTVTCPAAWAQTRRGVLAAAAQRAGLGQVTLVPEPVAAAQVFLTLPGSNARPGAAFVVYDLGAGTFDASVVRNAGQFFEVLATEGLSTSGGLDIDAAIVGYLGASHGGRNPDAWRRLAQPSTSAERRAHRMLWDDVRSAKEILSRTASTMVHVPPLDTDVPLGRDQFEQLARPILTATVTATRAALAAAGLSAADVDGVFLVGGGSRIPLVATLLHQALGKAPTVVEQPELVVAQGAVGASIQFTLPTTAPVSAPPVSALPASGGGYGAGPVAPVSPAFAAAPVTGYPAFAPERPSPPPAYGPVGGTPYAAPPPRGPSPVPSPAEKPKRRTGVVVAAFVAVVLVLGAVIGGALYASGKFDDTNSVGGGSRGSDQPTEVKADVEHPDVDWTSTAEVYEGAPDKTVGYQCPGNGSIGTVWGSGPYTADSSVCTSAVHAGKITLASGGHVIIKIETGPSSYDGTTQHDIVTTSYGPFAWAFEFVG